MHAGGTDYRGGAINGSQCHHNLAGNQRFSGQSVNNPQTDEALAQYFSLKPRTDGANSGQVF